MKTDLAISGVKSYFEKDFIDSLKGFTPGEWVAIHGKNKKQLMLGFVNPKVTRGPIAWTLGITLENFNTVEDYIRAKIDASFSYRKKIGISCGRLFYGAEDGLPGLIIDQYLNCIIIQITTAGIDKYREQIKKYCEDTIGGPVYFLDDKNYRAVEGLPTFENEPIIDCLEVRENDLYFNIPVSVLQKIGFYFDQGENRSRLITKVNQLNVQIKSCLDLFCYVGAWGLTATSLGATVVDYVDQADMHSVIENNIKINNLSCDSKFYRHDIFKNLPTEIANKKYDLVVFDPPALSKKKIDLKNAILGYEKGLRISLPRVNSGGLFVFSSCTHGVTFEDMCLLMSKCCKEAGKNARLVDLGIQRSDHPFSSLSSLSFYLKYILYIVNDEVL